MTRVEAYHILGDLWYEVTSKEAEAITIAQEAVQFVDLMPNDMVHVVRCQYCGYFADAKVNEKGFLICPASGMEITGMDYCSYGERKEGEE